VLDDFPKDSLAPAALMRKAAILDQLGRNTQAKSAYNLLIKTYPYSNEAKTAQDRLRTQ
jgi:TolA-binding protein